MSCYAMVAKFVPQMSESYDWQPGDGIRRLNTTLSRCVELIVIGYRTPGPLIQSRMLLLQQQPRHPRR